MRRSKPAARRVLTAWAAALAIALAVPAASRAAPRLADLEPGRYDLRVDGMLCHTCLRLAVDELASLKEVEKASGDFERDTLTVTVGPGRKLKASKIQRALRRAARRVDLGTKLELVSVRYRVL